MTERARKLAERANDVEPGGAPVSDLPDGRVPCAALPAILAGAMREKPVRNLGARLATPIGAFRLVDYLAITSESVGGALTQLSRYLRLSEAPYALELKTDEDPIRDTNELEQILGCSVEVNRSWNEFKLPREAWDRSLQRRLSAAGLTYQQLLDDARRDAAGTYLSDPALSVGEVAYLLGYSEAGAFHRAFKRWHGTTPQAFRGLARRNPKQAPV